MVISALWRCFSTARITLVSNLSPRILRIFVRPVSTSLRMALVTSYCLPVYSTFMSAPPRKFVFEIIGHYIWSLVVCHWPLAKPCSFQSFANDWQPRTNDVSLFLYPALMCARDAHVFA